MIVVLKRCNNPKKCLFNVFEIKICYLNFIFVKVWWWCLLWYMPIFKWDTFWCWLCLPVGYTRHSSFWHFVQFLGPKENLETWYIAGNGGRTPQFNQKSNQMNKQKTNLNCKGSIVKFRIFRSANIQSRVIISRESSNKKSGEKFSMLSNIAKSHISVSFNFVKFNLGWNYARQTDVAKREANSVFSWDSH